MARYLGVREAWYIADAPDTQVFYRCPNDVSKWLIWQTDTARWQVEGSVEGSVERAGCQIKGVRSNKQRYMRCRPPPPHITALPYLRQL